LGEIGKIIQKQQKMKSKDQKKVEELNAIGTEMKKLMLKTKEWFANQEK
jgi:hypothetical protein